MTYSKSNLDSNRTYVAKNPRRKYADIPAEIKVRMSSNSTKRRHDIERMTEENRRLR